MQDSWAVLPLRDLVRSGASVSYGLVQPGADFANGIPIIRVADIRDGRIATASPLHVDPNIEARFKRTRLQGGELLITLVGTVGETAVVPKALAGWNTARAVAVIPVREEIGAYWLSLALKTPAVQQIMMSRLNTTVQATLNLRDLTDLPIIVPPPSDRRAIVSILGALDGKIELNRKMSATLEAIARALFKSWFVDFDPVRAKAEGQDPGLPAEIAALFPDSFEETAHGQIPSGWRLVSLDEMVEINPTTSLAGVPEAPYLDMSNVPTTGHAVNMVITRTVSAGSRFKLGDTLLARITPCLENGKTAFVDFLPEGVVGWGSTEFIVMRPRDPMPKEYGYLLSRSEAFRAYAIGKMTGTSGRQRVPTDSLSSYPVVQPCAAMCAVFASVIQPFFRRMSAISLESRTLAALRDALLPKLISGELRVGEAERVLAASA